MSASPAASFGPTLLSSVTRRAASSRSVSGSVAAGGLLDADEVGVERLVAFMDLDLDVGVRELHVLRDARRLVGIGLGTHDQRDELRVAFQQRVEQRDGSITRRLR